VPLGDVPQRVAPLDLVDRGRPRGRDRDLGIAGGAAPEVVIDHERAHRLDRGDQVRPRLGGGAGAVARGDEGAEQRGRGDEPGRPPLDPAGQRDAAGLAAPDVGDGLDDQGDQQLGPHQPAHQRQGLHEEGLGDVRVAQRAGHLVEGGHLGRQRRPDPRHQGHRDAHDEHQGAHQRDEAATEVSGAVAGSLDRLGGHRRLVWMRWMDVRC
jgi:hypothetical protein